MKIFKNILLGILIFFASGIISYYAYKVLFKAIDTLNQSVPQRENLQDTILQQSELARMHADSAQFYREKADASFKEYITVVADTSLRNSLRAAYRANLEAKIRAGLAGQRDSLRVP